PGASDPEARRRQRRREPARRPRARSAAVFLTRAQSIAGAPSEHGATALARARRSAPHARVGLRTGGARASSGPRLTAFHHGPPGPAPTRAARAGDSLHRGRDRRGVG